MSTTTTAVVETKQALGVLRWIQCMRDICERKAKPQIRRERTAYYLFEALDEVPDGWPDDLGEGVSDYYCLPCANKAIAKGRKAGLAFPRGNRSETYDGPYQDHSGEGESSRNCYLCGRPLPWALLKYGMEAEVEHYTSQWFREKSVEYGVDADGWYWLWRVTDECAECDDYLLVFGGRLLATFVWLRDNGFVHADPDTPCTEVTTFEAAKREVEVSLS